MGNRRVTVQRSLLISAVLILLASVVLMTCPMPAQTASPSPSADAPAAAPAAPATPATPEGGEAAAPAPELASEAVALVIRYFEALKRGDYRGAVDCLEGYVDGGRKVAALGDFMHLYPSQARIDLMKCEENLLILSSQVKKYYYTRNRAVPATLKDALDKELYQVPACPSAGKDTYTEGYSAAKKGFNYTLLCSGENHGGAGLAKNLPAYTNGRGLVSRRIWQFPGDCRWRLDSYQILSVLRAGGMFLVRVKERSLMFEESSSASESEYFVARLDGGRGYRILLLPTLGKLEPEKKDLESYLNLLHLSRSIVFFCNWMENPDFWKDRAERSVVGCLNNLKSLGDALELYAFDHDGELPKALSALVPAYMPYLPLCPGAERVTYGGGYNLDRRSQRYILCCRGHNHLEGGLKANYPRLDSIKGLLTH